MEIREKPRILPGMGNLREEIVKFNLGDIIQFKEIDPNIHFSKYWGKDLVVVGEVGDLIIVEIKGMKDRNGRKIRRRWYEWRFEKKKLDKPTWEI